MTQPANHIYILLGCFPKPHPLQRRKLIKNSDGDGRSVNNPLRFPGQYWDWETQTHYNYFRQYDPRTGRYTQHDPIGLDGGMNPYGYDGGNPVAIIDPEGLASFLVGRPLQPPLSSLDGHMYVVAGADCVGDKKGTVYSYGQKKTWKLGRVRGLQDEGFLSKGTHAADEEHWFKLASNQNSRRAIQIPAVDATVKYFASSVKEDWVYNPFSINSNSASQAVANKASGAMVLTPDGFYLGVALWRWIRFE